MPNLTDHEIVTAGLQGKESACALLVDRLTSRLLD